MTTVKTSAGSIWIKWSGEDCSSEEGKWVFSSEVPIPEWRWRHYLEVGVWWDRMWRQWDMLFKHAKSRPMIQPLRNKPVGWRKVVGGGKPGRSTWGLELAAMERMVQERGGIRGWGPELAAVRREVQPRAWTRKCVHSTASKWVYKESL